MKKNKVVKYIFIVSIVLIFSLLQIGLITSANKGYSIVKTPDELSTIDFTPPVEGYVSSGLEAYPGHTGADIVAPIDTEVVSALAGTVYKVDDNSTSGYGKHVVIDHGNGIQTLYAHLSKITVSVGDKVAQGDKIGVIGATGRTTGTYLHFEIRVNGEFNDPESYIDFSADDTASAPKAS